jgi:hypothetical protein
MKRKPLPLPEEEVSVVSADGRAVPVVGTANQRTTGESPTYDPAPPGPKRDQPVHTSKKRRFSYGKRTRDQKSVTFVADPIGRGCTGVHIAFAHGPCLEPSGIHSGQIMVVGAGIDPREGDLVTARIYATTPDGQRLPFGPTVKHWHRRGDHVILRPTHPDHEPFLEKVDDVKVIGVVISSHDAMGDALDMRYELSEKLPKPPPIRCQRWNQNDDALGVAYPRGSVGLMVMTTSLKHGDLGVFRLSPEARSLFKTSEECVARFFYNIDGHSLLRANVDDEERYPDINWPTPGIEIVGKVLYFFGSIRPSSPEKDEERRQKWLAWKKAQEAGAAAGTFSQ